MRFCKEARESLMELSKDGIYLEGNILKVIEEKTDSSFVTYLNEAVQKDKETRKKRLEITKQIQSQNNELIKTQAENAKLMEELKIALKKSQDAKETAENDLDILQKKSQFELIDKIVKVALALIVGVGVVTTILYATAIVTGKETALIGTAWSSMFGILLTNSFSIIGTIMGVKYASSNSSDE
jgi:hypothetical protein